jgi:long-chain acyl-CoA synthetase
MLYQRWRQIVHDQKSELALYDFSTERAWTFAELDHAAEEGLSVEPVRFPKGHSVEFLLEMQRAWRDGAKVCPLEPGQSAPAFASFPDGCSHFKLTSASTGAPRIVAFTEAQLAADAGHIVSTMGLRRDSPNLGMISLAHSYGFSNLILPLLLHGIPLVLAPAPLPVLVRRATDRFAPLTIPAVPALWRTWHDAGVLAAPVRLAISAGAPLPLALEEEVFAATGLKIHNFYGATECGGIAFDRSDKPRQDATCAGEPLEGVNLAVSEDGCLQIRSRAVGETYWPEPDDGLRDGCFQTSDVAELRERRVYLRGRLGDQINVSGRKLSPETVESALAEHPAVKQCLVFGVPEGGDLRGETIVACVEAAPGIASEQLRQFLMERLPSWQVPKQWWLVPSLSVNVRGKLSRAEWKRRFLERC